MAWTHFVTAIFLGRVVRFAVLSYLTYQFGPQMVTLFRGVIRQHPFAAIGVVVAIVATVLLVRRSRGRTPAVQAVE
jgi:membrane protein DedA with SNARE-associated domain